jgi:hypothetical protein
VVAEKYLVADLAFEVPPASVQAIRPFFAPAHVEDAASGIEF